MFNEAAGQGGRGRSRSAPKGKPTTTQDRSEGLGKFSDATAALSLTALATPAAPALSTIFGVASLGSKLLQIGHDYIYDYSESSYSNEQAVLEFGLSASTAFGAHFVQSISIKDFGRLTPLGRVTAGAIEAFNYIPDISLHYIENNR